VTAKAKFRIEGEDASAAAWKSAVGRANQSAEKMKHAFEAAFAGVSVAVVAELGRKAFEVGDQFSKAATKAGIGGKSFTSLAYAAKLADVDVEALSTSIKKMQVNLSEAATGAKQPTLALQALGLKFEDIKDLEPDKQFELLGERIHELKDPADRARAATEFFGKAGADLLPLFEQGAAGIAKARAEAEQLGLVFDDEHLKKLADAEDAIKRLGAAWQGFYLTLATHVAPTVANVLDSLSGTRTGELKQQIAFLEKVQGEGFVAVNPLGSHGAYKDIAGVHSAEEGAALLGKLRGELDLSENLHPELGGRGVHTGMPPGYKKADAADKAAAAAQKADAESAKLVDQFMKNADELGAAFDQQMDKELKDSNEAWSDQMIGWQKFEDDRLAAEEETNQQIALYREEQATASAQQYIDIFNGAFSAMENNGKLSASRFFQYLGAELVRLGVTKLLGGVLGSVFGTSSPIDGADDFVNTYAGARAGGGDVRPGGDYIVGELGPERLRMGRNGRGYIAPNSQVRGRQSPNVNINIDARGSTTESVGQLAKFGAEIKRQVFDTLSRDYHMDPA
jgi:hypothetical protein